MSYIVSHPYRCPKCGHEENAGGTDMDYWTKSPITENGNPICTKCWNEFLKTLGAEMRCTVNWTGISDYDKHYNTETK